MPLYEYCCEACGDREERLESLSAPPSHACPECGAADGMKRQLSTVSFALSGGGWYKQGYGSDGAASATPKAEAPASGGGCCAGGGCPHKA